MPNEEVSVLGLMSGSSMDGLDLAFCSFRPSAEGLEWKIVKAATIPFSEIWVSHLKKLPGESAYTLAKADADFGRYLGELAHAFLESHNLAPNLIASHGHTIFHYPNEGFSMQLGDGAAIAARSGYNVADNFRMQDVALGGQGAPLAPVADEMLFPDYDILLNLGGIANLSCKTTDGYIAFDLTGANQVLNHLVKPLGIPHDHDGRLAAQGKLLDDLLESVEQLPFFDLTFPKSLGNDWVLNQQLPLYDQADASIPDKLHTACKQIARQITKGVALCLDQDGVNDYPLRMLATGGGVFNEFLMRCIREELKVLDGVNLEIPEADIIHYKEALLMALMGYLRLNEVSNCLPTATGARRPAVGGALHLGWKAKRI